MVLAISAQGQASYLRRDLPCGLLPWVGGEPGAHISAFLLKLLAPSRGGLLLASTLIAF